MYDVDPREYLSDEEIYGDSPRMMYCDPNFIDDEGYGKDGCYYGLPEEPAFCDCCGEELDEDNCTQDSDGILCDECYNELKKTA